MRIQLHICLLSRREFSPSSRAENIFEVGQRSVAWQMVELIIIYYIISPAESRILTFSASCHVRHFHSKNEKNVLKYFLKANSSSPSTSISNPTPPEVSKMSDLNVRNKKSAGSIGPQCTMFTIPFPQSDIRGTRYTCAHNRWIVFCLQHVWRSSYVAEFRCISQSFESCSKRDE